MARISAEDRRTATAGNLAHLRALTDLDPVSEGQLEMKAALPVKEVPAKEAWRLGLLDSLLRERRDHEVKGLCLKRVVALISSLCTT